MTNTIKVTREVEVRYLQVDLGVRYWEDATWNGRDEDDNVPNMYGINSSGDRLEWTIDLKSGKILGWPEGATATTHYKVCDDGVYKALDGGFHEVAEVDGYVPAMLYPGRNGYADYVILDIDHQGKIKDFFVDLTFFEESE